MGTFKRLSYIIWGTLLSIVLLLTFVNIIAFDLNHYNKSFVKHNIVETTGMNSENLGYIIRDILKYLKDDRKELNTRIIIEGEENEVFGDREKLHMVDVKGLFVKGRVLRNVGIALSILMFLFFIRKDQYWKKSVPGTLLYTAAADILFLLVLLLLIKIDPGECFYYFHVMFFDNDLWQLDPNTDILVQMLPESFFYSTAIRVVSYFAISLIILGSLGLYFDKRTGKGGYAMHNIAKIRLDEKEKKGLEQYKKDLLNYLKILDEFDINLAHTKIEDVKNNTV